ncbi:MAG: DUF1223 domain-containing protein [Pseudomonadota bacterium]
MLTLIFLSFPASAQNITIEAQTPVVVELFSSQACAFCPKADEIMGDIAKMRDVIALNCHVDYFDVKEGALSKPFCTDRQTEYVGMFGGGTHYTPQMVVNGHMDVIGYQAEKISAALVKGRADRIDEIDITRRAEGVFEVSLKPQDLSGRQAKLWMATIDKPHRVTIASGANKGKNMVYANILNSLNEQGNWDGTEKRIAVSPQLTDSQTGFAVFAQDTQTGRMVAAGQFMR